MKKTGVSVSVRAQTWSKDSHSLFDFETSKLTKTHFKTSSCCYIIRRDQEVIHSISRPIGSIESRYLSQVQLIENHFAISPVTHPTGVRSLQYEKNWLVVKLLSSNKGYQITEGDVLKMGRLKFRVKELKGADPSRRIKNFSLADLISNKSDSEESEDDCPKFSLPCRICLCESYTEINPLICPCNCDGTMKYIHLKCLQRALRSKVTTRASESALSFSWKIMSCDLCKKPYPYNFILAGQSVELIKIPKPPEKYIILEGLCKDKDSSKWLHVICLNSKDSIRIGRANECELKLTDISVSRNHGNIRLAGEQFYLEDKGSKFGTLVQIKRPVGLEFSQEVSVQAGRTLLTFSVKKPWSIIPTCFRSSISYYELSAAPYVEGVAPLLPINTGIPLSVSDAEELLSRAGIHKKKSEDYKENDNLMFEHGQLGFNSSLEDEAVDGVEPTQEILVAVDGGGEREVGNEAYLENEHGRSRSYI